MAEKERPTEPEIPPDPARSYERAKPEEESGMGRLDNEIATPTDDPDRPEQAVKNIHPPRGVNAEEVIDDRQSRTPAPPPRRSAEPPEQPDHSMHDEEPMDWDLAPFDIHNPRHKRHPRTEGKGGLP